MITTDEEEIVYIARPHPYFDFLEPSIAELGYGMFRVKYRSFDTQKQDNEFPSMEEARSFASRLMSEPAAVRVEDFADADRFWRELDGQRPK